jgi:hypothetical protein
MAEPTAPAPGPIPYSYWTSPVPEGFLAIFKAAVPPQPGPAPGHAFLCIANQAAKQRAVKVYIKQLPQGDGRPPIPVIIEMVDVCPE